MSTITVGSHPLRAGGAHIHQGFKTNPTTVAATFLFAGGSSDAAA